MNISPDVPVDPMIFILGGISIIWFSWYDIMDGQRARRLKVGSPLGRIIDEGGDTIVMSNYALITAYWLKANHPILEFTFYSMNMAFFGMELRHKLCNDLVMSLGEFGPVEVEHGLGIVFILSGIFGWQGL